jgi:hypothetical protein
MNEYNLASDLCEIFNYMPILNAPMNDGADLSSAKSQFALKQLFHCNSVGSTPTFAVTSYDSTAIDWAIADNGILSVSVAP